MTQCKTDSITRIHRDTPISEMVVSTVAQAKGVDPLELEPLYNVVDPDALDSLFASNDGQSSMELCFEMAGCEVVVDGAGEVAVTPPETESSSLTVTTLDD
jgi:hypothetical protein